MNIALLGARGFVGMNIGQELKEYDYTVFPVSFQTGFDLRKSEDNFRFIAESNCDVIINCAAHVGSLNYVTELAADIISDNSRMILNLYEAVQKLKPSCKIIQPIANCGYPANAVLYKEEEMWDGPLHPSVISYGFTRRMLLLLSETYRMQYGIESINLITPNMYGPYDSTDPNKAHAFNAIISKFVKALHTNQESVEIWGTGVAVREWLYAPDFAKIIAEILQNINDDKYKVPFNIAQEDGLNVRNLVNLITKHIAYKGKVWYNHDKPDGAPRKVMYKGNFNRVFPSFEFTTLEEGIKTTASYYQSIYPY
jgi:GDP-L-fucose synthase